LEKEGVNSFGLLQSDDRKTTVKTRIIGNNQQLLRIDSEQTNEINNRDEINLLEKIDQLLKEGIDAVIFEDYNKGVLTQKVINEVIRKCNDAGIPTTVDPKKENFLAYKNCTLFKPNLKELKEGINVSFSIEDKVSFENAVLQLNSILNNRFTFITLSEHGVYIQSDDEKKYIPAHIRTIADVSGAGDTVISVATLCLCIGLNIEQVASFANLAGGLVCEKSGVVSIEREQLMNEIRLLTKSEIL
jgi:rfaE bifunctional protein kinase chain/domain